MHTFNSQNLKHNKGVVYSNNESYPYVNITALLHNEQLRMKNIKLLLVKDEIYQQ